MYYTKQNKKLFVIAATKHDKVHQIFFNQVKIVAKQFNIEVIPTSIEMEDSWWVTESFKYLAIKLFNLQSEDAYGVVGDSYFRSILDSLTKEVQPMSKSEKTEERSETLSIPPRNYNLEGMSPEPQSPRSSLAGSLDNHGFGDVIGEPHITNLDQTFSQSKQDSSTWKPLEITTKAHTEEQTIAARPLQNLPKDRVGNWGDLRYDDFPNTDSLEMAELVKPVSVVKKPLVKPRKNL